MNWNATGVRSPEIVARQTPEWELAMSEPAVAQRAGGRSITASSAA